MKKKVLIAIPTAGPMMWAKTAIDLANLVAYSHIKFDIGLVNIKGALIPILRDKLTNFAKKNKFDYILFIDSDMRFPSDSIIRLMAHDKYIIGCNAAIKGEYRPVIRTDVFGIPLCDYIGEIAEVEKIGMGVTLINMAVFDKLTKPYFHIDYSEDGEDYWGEDSSFCGEARAEGFKIYCELNLSKEIIHVGECEYKMEDVEWQ